MWAGTIGRTRNTRSADPRTGNRGPLRKARYRSRTPTRTHPRFQSSDTRTARRKACLDCMAHRAEREARTLDVLRPTHIGRSNGLPIAPARCARGWSSPRAASGLRRNRACTLFVRRRLAGSAPPGNRSNRNTAFPTPRPCTDRRWHRGRSAASRARAGRSSPVDTSCAHIAASSEPTTTYRIRTGRARTPEDNAMFRRSGWAWGGNTRLLEAGSAARALDSSRWARPRSNTRARRRSRGSWCTASSRDSKTNLRPLEVRDMRDRLNIAPQPVRTAPNRARRRCTRPSNSERPRHRTRGGSAPEHRRGPPSSESPRCIRHRARTSTRNPARDAGRRSSCRGARRYREGSEPRRAWCIRT